MGTFESTSATATNLTRNDQYEWCVVANCSSGPSIENCQSFTAAPGGRLAQGSGEMLQLYPNPASDWVNVRFNLEGVEGLPTQVQVHDLSGRLMHGRPVEAEIDYLEMDVSHLPNAVYVVRVLGADGNLEAAKKLLISR